MEFSIVSPLNTLNTLQHVKMLEKLDVRYLLAPMRVALYV